MYIVMQEKRDKKEIKILGRKQLSYPIMEHNNIEQTRKVIEYLLRDIDIDVMLYTLQRPENKQKQSTDTKKSRNENAVVVRANGKTYAELLKDVKENVDTTALGVNVDCVRKTRKEDLLILMTKGTGEAEKLKESIEKKQWKQSRKHTKRGENSSTHQRTGWGYGKTDIKQAIEEEGIPMCDFEITSLRPANNKSKVVTIKIKKVFAQKLLDKGRIRTGWNICRVQQRIPTRVCRRCWRDDHDGKICEGPDWSKLYRRCGESGHMAALCKNKHA